LLLVVELPNQVRFCSMKLKLQWTSALISIQQVISTLFLQL